MTATIDTGLTKAERTDVAQELSKVLADSFAVYLKTHGYHWNVRGPEFYSLHNLLEQQYRDIWAALDEIAERIRALGAPAPASYHRFAALTVVPEDTDFPDAQEMVRRLVSAHEATARTIRTLMPLAEGAPDQVSVDLLVRRLDVHEKTAWMLRSILA